MINENTKRKQIWKNYTKRIKLINQEKAEQYQIYPGGPESFFCILKTIRLF